MMSVKFICVGRMRENYYTAAFSEYAKRLGAYCKFETVEVSEEKVPEKPSDKQLAAALAEEAAGIARQIPKGAYTVALCIEGKRLSSAAFAELFAGRQASGVSKVCFIVGGSFGLDEALKSGADFRLSMSDMTFPHHLARVMLAEQVYRAFSIIEGGRYHK